MNSSILKNDVDTNIFLNNKLTKSEVFYNINSLYLKSFLWRKSSDSRLFLETPLKTRNRQNYLNSNIWQCGDGTE